MFIYRVVVKYVVQTGKREFLGGALRVDVVIARYHL